MPGLALAAGHGGEGHGGGGHGGHGGGWGHTNYSFSFGFGYYGPGPYYYPFYYPYYSHYYYPSYYPYYPYYDSPGVVYVGPPAAPHVVVQQPIVVQQYSNPAPAYGGDLDKIREKKAQLLGQLQQGDKTERLHAIDQLAGFSYDDQVRGAMENVLQSDPDALIRKAVVEAFGKVKNQKPLGVLEKVRVADSDREVREAADRSINQIKN